MRSVASIWLWNVLAAEAVQSGGRPGASHRVTAFVGDVGGLVDLRDGARALHRKEPNDDMHIVFSTSCNEFQHWQTEVLLNTAQRVGQRGKITHIVVGCEEREDAGMEGHERILTHAPGLGDNLVPRAAWANSSMLQSHIHYAPAIPEAKEFPWFNKPWSFYHWAQNARPQERVIVIIDPDEFFLEPLTQGQKKRSELINTWPDHLQHLVTDWVRPGMAVAQQYGFGSAWVSLFDRKQICGNTSYCASIGEEDANLYYPVGPPYLIHQHDFQPVMESWWTFMKPTYQADKGDIQADMYAYTMAAAHKDVKHVRLDQYMVSNPEAEGEGWAWIDSVRDMSCRNMSFPHGASRPTFIHATGHYMVCSKGDTPTKDGHCSRDGSELWNFHKGHVPSNILDCSASLLVEPPDELFNVQDKATNRRNAFMICSLHKMVNDAALDLRMKYCATGFNDEKCVRLSLLGDDEFPLARRVCGRRAAREDDVTGRRRK